MRHLLNNLFLRHCSDETYRQEFYEGVGMVLIAVPWCVCAPRGKEHRSEAQEGGWLAQARGVEPAQKTRLSARR
jgi:hypothetical protein